VEEPVGRISPTEIRGKKNTQIRKNLRYTMKTSFSVFDPLLARALLENRVYKSRKAKIVPGQPERNG